MTTTSILQPNLATASALPAGLASTDAATGSSSGTPGSSGTDSATISANDFLTLLVTEMQNQDPTADTDPNEYINQLVEVNSLEQLISMNQTLTGAFGGGGSTKSTSGTVAEAATSGQPSLISSKAGNAASLLSQLRGIAGNLSAPGPNSAAQRVAHALGNASRKQ